MAIFGVSSLSAEEYSIGDLADLGRAEVLDPLVLVGDVLGGFHEPRVPEGGPDLLPAMVEAGIKLAEHIRSTYEDRLTLLEGDAVKVPFPGFDVFVSNLPYSVSTPIIFKLLEQDFRTAVVTSSSMQVKPEPMFTSLSVSMPNPGPTSSSLSESVMPA